MPASSCAELKELQTSVAKSLAMSTTAMKLLHRNCGGRVKRYVFEARCSRDVCALKCFVLPLEDEEEQRKVEKEVQVAEWAAQQQLGTPVRGVIRMPRVTVLVMAMALADFETVLRSCHRLPYAQIRELFDQAFRLVTHEKLVARGLICSDLKPANFLLQAMPRACTAFDLAAAVKGNVRKGLGVELRLADFDPFFWSEAASEEVALLNGFFLLANCVFWKMGTKLGPYLPPQATGLAAAVRCRAGALMQALSKHRGLLMRGPVHYAWMSPGEKSSQDAFLEALSEALTRHGL